VSLPAAIAKGAITRTYSMGLTSKQSINGNVAYYQLLIPGK
jgi:hypothetical protein